MPNRWVREDAIESEAVNAVPWLCEVFWRRLLNRCDDFGRYTANLTLLRTKIFPLQMDKVSEADLARLLSECEAVGLLFTYTGEDGKPYLALNKFEKGRAKHSKYPDPPPDVCKRMKAFVYRCTHAHANAPTSDFRLPTSEPDSGKERTGAGNFPVEPPPGMPDTEERAGFIGERAGVPKERAIAYWNELASRGWRDSRGNQIFDFGRHAKVRHDYEVSNKAERAAKTNGRATAGLQSSVWGLQKQLDAINVEIKKIQNRGHEDPVAGLVIKQEDKPQYRELKKKRDELNAQIARGNP